MTLLLLIMLAMQDSSRTYDLVPDSSDNIHAAIDRAVEHMSFIARPIARHRLRKANPTPQHLTLEFSKDTILVRRGEEPPAALPRDGSAVPWEGAAGDKCRISLVIAGDTLIEHVVGHGGQSEARYVVADSGRRVREDVKITSPHLPEAVVYSVRFARTP